MKHVNCIHQIWHKDYGIIYHSLLGRPVLVNRNGYKYLMNGNEDRPEKVHKIRKELLDIDHVEASKRIKNRAESHVEFIQKEQRLESLSLLITRQCNFKCAYCIHFEAENSLTEKPQNKSMSFEIAKKAIDIFFHKLKVQGQSIADIELLGGEPLINWGIIERILSYVYERYAKNYEVTFGMVTNLTLLDCEKIEYLKKYNVQLFSSIDGGKEYHDKFRRYKNNDGTFSDVMDKIALAQDFDYPIPGFSFTMTEENMGGLSMSFIEYVKNTFGIQSIHGDYSFLQPRPSNAEKISEALMDIFRATFEKQIRMNGTFSSSFVNMMNGHYHEHVTAFCEKLKGMNLSVDPDGKLFLCTYFPMEVGRLESLQEYYVNRENLSSIYNFVCNIRKECFGCVLEGLCQGGCPCGGYIKGNRDYINTDMCELYRDIFIKLTKWMLHILQKDENQTRQFFHPSSTIDKIIDAIEICKRDKTKILIEPITGVDMNLCSGGLSADSNTDYLNWYEMII